ncbi:MAG: hypothetical protein IPQ08_04960 [Chitinophagaceae bacterium]|nr:hypothetical protein [Chitinophagaceae bacterium]
MVRLLLFFIISSLLISCGMGTVLQEYKRFPDYSSASAVEFSNGRFYIMGDDSFSLLVLDTNLNELERIPVFTGTEKRIPKPVKPDLEAMTLLPGNKLLMIGSASLVPQRAGALVFDMATKTIDSIRLDFFFSRFAENHLGQVNIEGMTLLPSAMVLANRGHMNYPHNELVFTTPDFYKKPEQAYISKMLFGVNEDSSSFQGISGLAYSNKKDLLIATISTEKVDNSYDDGEIGKSYLWLVKNMSAKTQWKAMNPDQVIDLEKIDPAFKGQKIEGVCVWKETKEFLYLLLVADNDDGGSNMFKLAVKL